MNFGFRVMLAGAGLIRRVARCKRGVAAVEFGMIVPIMFMLFVGAVEFSQAITVDRRVTQIASSTADLVARQTSMTSTDMAGYLQIVSTLMSPYTTSLLKLTVLSVYATTAAPTNTLICWSYNYNGGTATYSDGAAYTLPTGVVSGGTSVIVAETLYNYQPLIFKYFINSNTFPMSEKFYLKPRLSAAVQLDTKKCL
jgi:Flp pilus assembly protein TadG